MSLANFAVLVSFILASNILYAGAKRVDLHGQFSTISSKNYPLRYPVSEKSTWVVHRLADDVCAYSIEFLAMDIASTKGICNDFLEINGKYYCGSKRPSPITVYVEKYHDLVIRFSSDDSVTGMGFSIIVEQNRFSCSYIPKRKVTSQPTLPARTTKVPEVTIAPTVPSKGPKVTVAPTVPSRGPKVTDAPTVPSKAPFTTSPVATRTPVPHYTSSFQWTRIVTPEHDLCESFLKGRCTWLITRAHEHCIWSLEKVGATYTGYSVEMRPVRNETVSPSQCDSRFEFTRSTPHDYRRVCHNYHGNSRIYYLRNEHPYDLTVTNNHTTENMIAIVCNRKCGHFNCSF